jgi:hypothetical protein
MVPYASGIDTVTEAGPDRRILLILAISFPVPVLGIDSVGGSS